MKKSYFLLAALSLLISISTISALTTDYSPTRIEGSYCVEYHGGNYLIANPQLNYGGAAIFGEELEFSVILYPRRSGMIFNATVELYNLPEELSIHEGQSVQNKPDMNYNSFIPTWIISSNVEGNFSFNIKTTVTVKYLQYHTDLNTTYEYQYNATFQVLEDSVEPVFLIENIPRGGNLFLNWEINLGRILGIFSTILVYFCIQLGIPVRKEWIRKKMGWSSKKLRGIHRDLGYLSMTTIVLHNIFLSLNAMWGNYFQWYQFYPTFYVYNNGWNNLTVGLDLAVFGSLFFLITTITGIYFKKIARKFNYRTAILTQQISYLALIFSVVHAILNGSWTLSNPILMILQIWVLFEIFISRIIAYFNPRYLTKKRKIIPSTDLVNIQDQNLIEISQEKNNSKIKQDEQRSSFDNRSQ